MDHLIENASRIIETMRESIASGPATEVMTVYVGPDGDLHIIAGECMPFESLTWSEGARMTWRATWKSGRVRVEGLDGRRSCVLEEPAPRTAGSRLLGETRMYQAA